MHLSIFAFRRKRWLHRFAGNTKFEIRNPIIAITAHAMAGDEEKNIATGMEEHVTKRIDPDELFASL